MRILPFAFLALASLLTACQRAAPPAAAPAPAPVSQAAPTVATVPAASTAAPPATTHPAATAATAPAATSAAAASTAAAPAAATSAESAGSVALAQGSVTDTATDGSHRELKDGDTVYPGDAFAIGDDSYLDLDLEDGGRILLRPDTNFQIQEYHFDPDAHPAAGEAPLLANPQAKPESAFFNLVKGGLRAVDGLIGQSHPQNYGVETPVATIGVRGTAFDVRYCGSDCQDEAGANGAPQNGLYTSVTEGSIGVKNDSGETVTKAGEYSYVQSRKQAVQKLAQAPAALKHMSLPPQLKARADKNRAQIDTHRQQLRQQVLQRRRQQAAKANPRVEKPAAERPEERRAPAAKPGAEPALERRQQRMQERQERRQAAPEQRPQEAASPERKLNTEPPRQQQPQPQPQQSAPETRRQRFQDRLNQLRQQHAAQPQAQPQQQVNKPDCKDKKRKRGEKDKDKCGG